MKTFLATTSSTPQRGRTIIFNIELELCYIFDSFVPQQQAQIHFCPKIVATGRLGHSAEQNVAAAHRVLDSAEAFVQPDHFLRMGDESVRQSFLTLAQQVTEVYAHL
jgi:hypothetical protein